MPRQATTTVSISMPASMKRLAERRMQSGGFNNMSEYFRHLLRESERSDSRIEHLLRLLEAGAASGPGMTYAPAEWKAASAASLARAHRRANPRRKKAG